MDLTYCERCGCFYEEKDSIAGDYIIMKVIDSQVDCVSATEIGLCPKCMSSFINWFKKVEVDNG